MRDELERVEIPGEEDARKRAWSVAREAFAEREPTPRPSHWPRIAAVALAASALLAAAFSPPGRAVLDEIREVVGVERAQPALFSLPATGRLLVTSDAGLWVVQADGSKRLLGEYLEGSWSPFGRFVVAARENELVALEPDGKVRWTLARPRVRSPRWAGTETDTRIAYLSGRRLRVVLGDGSNDRVLVPRVAAVAPAWRPGPGFELAFVNPRGRIVVVDAVSGRIVTRPGTPRGARGVRELEWSRDGQRLLARWAGPRFSVLVYTSDGVFFRGVDSHPGTMTAAAIRPRSHDFAYAVAESGRSRLFVTGVRRAPLSGPGSFDDLAWSPGGRWLLVGWPAADQWVFVRADMRRIRAVSNVSDQFRSRTFPRVEGWCCAP